MIDFAVNSATVREKWSEFIDNTIRIRPGFIKRNRDILGTFSLDQLAVLVEHVRFKMEYEQEEDGSYSGSIIGFDLVGNAPTVEELRQELAEQLMEYAQMYMEYFQLNYNAPNRRPHFPFVLKVLLEPDLKGVVSLIRV